MIRYVKSKRLLYCQRIINTELTEEQFMSEPTTHYLPDTVPAADQILKISFLNLVIARVVYMIAKLGIPDLLHNTTLKSEELAKKTGSHPRSLYRLLRAASNAGILSESQDHSFSLTSLGDVLRSDAPGSMRGFVIFEGEPFYLRTWEDLPYSIRTGKPSFEKVHGVSHFEYFRRNPEMEAIFDQCMTDWSHNDALAVTKAFDFSRCRTIVDIGGGHGILLTNILKVNPHVRGVLFEQHQVIEGAQSRLKREGLLPRCELVSDDFFTSVPSGADAYIMKSILHDWSDDQSLAILRTCRRAMGDKGRLLIIETIVPPPGEPHYAKYQEVEMLVLLGGQERTVEEYENLLAKAEFKLSRVVTTEALHSIIEAVLV
jgi:hypothetical protein